MHSSYYNQQIIQRLETVADNIAGAIGGTSDVNVTNSSFAVTNSALTSLDDCIASSKIDVNLKTSDITLPISGTIVVSSLPAVSGTVAVSSLPSVTVSTLPAISGTVAVSTLPSVTISSLPAVSGTVAVSSLPAVSGTVAVSTLPAITGVVSTTGTTTISGAVTVSSGSISAACSGTVAVSSLPAITGAVTVSSGSITASCSGTVAVSGTPTVDQTKVAGTTVAVNSGALSAGVQRVCVASDDINIKCMTNLGFDFRYLSLNSDTVYSKFTKVQAKSYPPVSVISSALVISSNFGTGNPYDLVTDVICSLPNVSTPLHLLPTTTWTLPYDNFQIACFSANDSTAGTYARTVRMVYYDNTWTLQSVSHPLSNTGTTYSVRRLVTFEVETWGANLFNEDSIVLQNPVNGRFACWIHQQNNKAHFNHIAIPLNGYVLLDSMTAYMSTAGTVRLLLWKQLSSSGYTYTTIFQRYCNGTQPPIIDLSYLLPIYGPTSSTENWGIVMGVASTNSVALFGNIDLNGKIYSP